MPFIQTQTSMHTLCKRIERFLPELFVFVAYPGGTRSPKGSSTRMGLTSLFGTWIAQGLNPFQQCLTLLTTKSSLG